MSDVEQPAAELESAAAAYPTKVMLEAHGIDIRIEGAEAAAELAQLALDAFARIHQLRPAAQLVGFAAGSGVQAERAEPLANPLDSPTLSPHIR